MYGRIDIEDAVAAPLFTLAAAVSTGVASVSVLGHSLSSEFANLGGTSFSIAFVIAIAALAFAYISNEPNLDSMNDEETYAVIGTFALVLGVPLIPGIESFVTGSDIAGLAAMSIEAAGYYSVSYLG